MKENYEEAKGFKRLNRLSLKGLPAMLKIFFIQE